VAEAKTLPERRALRKIDSLAVWIGFLIMLVGRCPAVKVC